MTALSFILRWSRGRVLGRGGTCSVPGAHKEQGERRGFCDIQVGMGWTGPLRGPGEDMVIRFCKRAEGATGATNKASVEGKACGDDLEIWGWSH